MACPPRETAHDILEQAHMSNPGPWLGHSLYTARSAEIIGGALGLDSERCYTSGLLHDIGRYEGLTCLRHAWSGYRYLTDRGYDDCARCALTHSFTERDVNDFTGPHDLDSAAKEFLQNYLRGIEFDDYDRLIQLCDLLALSDGFCIIEQRIVDVCLRHGFKAFLPVKWQAIFAIKADFDRRIGRNLYALLPGLPEKIIS